MSTEPCPSCGHPIRSDADGRFPPWCPKCGTDFKRPPATPAATPAAGDGPAVAVHAVTEPRVYHGSRNGRGFPTGPVFPPHIGGPVTMTSTVWARCWKQHTCVECGGVYRYKIVREAGGEGRLAESAREEAVTKLLQRLAREVDPNPCPSCGLIQPDMVSQGKRRGYALATVAAGLLLVPLVALSFVGGWLSVDEAARYAAAIAGGAAVGHLAVALSNPNRNREGNRRRGEVAVAAGRVEIVSPGTVTDSLPPVANITAAHVLALTCVVLAAPAYLLPVFISTGDDAGPQRMIWTIGAAVGLFASLAGGGALIGLSAAMRRRALAAEVIPLHPAGEVG